MNCTNLLIVDRVIMNKEAEWKENAFLPGDANLGGNFHHKIKLNFAVKKAVLSKAFQEKVFCMIKFCLFENL